MCIPHPYRHFLIYTLSLRMLPHPARMLHEPEICLKHVGVYMVKRNCDVNSTCFQMREIHPKYNEPYTLQNTSFGSALISLCVARGSLSKMQQHV